MDFAQRRRASLWTALIKQAFGATARCGGVIKAFKHRHPWSLHMSALQRSRGAWCRTGVGHVIADVHLVHAHAGFLELRCEDILRKLHKPDLKSHILKLLI